MKTGLISLVVGLALAAGIPSLPAQNTVVTYQGRVTSHGTNFTGSGQFKFALVTSTNAHHTATASATVSGGFVTIIAVNFGGNGYVSAPTVTIAGGGGAGAVATANLASGIVTSMTVNNPGSGYTSTPTVLLSAPPESLTFTTYWSNDGTSSAGSQPAAAVTTSVADGLFTVPLGDATQPNMTALSAALFQQTNLQLRIWFNNGVNGFAALSPLQNLTAAPYANHAHAATTLTAGNNQPVNLSINGTNVLRITSVYDSLYSSPTVNSVGGYAGNVISNGFVGGFIGGGGNSLYPNLVGEDYASVLGGVGNRATGFGATAMGAGNIASGTSSTAMGDSTTASGDLSTAMGFYTTASGYSSTAMGAYARANHLGSFVWADSTGGHFDSTASQQFSVRAGGGVRLVGNVQIGENSADYLRVQLGGGNSYGNLYGSFPGFGDGVHLSYNYYANSSGGNVIHNAGGGTSRISARYGEIILAVGAVNNAPYVQRLLANTTGVTVNGTFNNSSDRNLKQGFNAISPASILEQVAQLPISEWSYKEDATTRHIGPTAQDFQAAFKIGTDDKHIAPLDEGGVALAAIQGLNRKFEDGAAVLRAENQELKRALAELKAIVANLQSISARN